MPTVVFMPQLGESVVEGTITRWLKSPGDQVIEFEPLLEINTDKVDSEIPSPAPGVLLDILVPEGTTVKAGTALAWIGEPGEETPKKRSTGEEATTDGPSAKSAEAGEKPPHEKADLQTEKTSATAPVMSAGRDRELGFISPVVARIASERGVDLYQVEGTGQGGRITKKDILNYLERREKTKPIEARPIWQAPEGVEVQRPPIRMPAAPEAPIPAQPVAPSPSGEILPLDPVRRAIAEHMVFSKRTSPHVTTVMEADLMHVVADRQAHKDEFSRHGVNLTFTAYFVAASITALRAFPRVNSSWTEQGIQLHPRINIGLATSLQEEGLIVPVIKNADSFSLLGLARMINDLANRARSRQLQPDEVKGGTFTITNHGISGSLFATPIINQPQCAILGVGAIQKRVVVINDAIAIRPMVYLSLTFDHRIIDGAIADAFLGKVVGSLQGWGSSN